MDPSSSCDVKYDEETRALESLLDIFGSVCSLEEIASAYCKAGRDVCKSSEILCQLVECNSNSVIHGNHREVSSTQSRELLHENSNKNLKGSRPRKLSASMGTVSSVLGKAYARPTSSKNESSETTKPLKLELDKSLIDDLEVEPVPSLVVTRKEPLHDKDVEEFLFSMLGDGFKLSMDVIREVLGHCGYDVKKSMEELLSLSAKTLEKGKAIDCDMVGKVMAKNPKTDSCSFGENYLPPSQRNSAELSTMDNERSNLPREVLEALFSVPERSEEPKRKLEWGLNRTRVVGQSVVTKPLVDIPLTPLTDISKLKADMKNVLDDEDEYQVIRRAVKLHWDTMKAYYEAAIDAFAKGDRAQANYLLEQGKYYNQMAREADEKTAGGIIETRKPGIQADLTLDLHSHYAKEALSLLKFHLHKLASIPSFRFLEVIVNTDAEDVTKGKRKRLVTKLLEKESIKWTEEEGNPGTIFIQLDVIDRNKLSFVEGPK